jgi:hypothetical protein
MCLIESQFEKCNIRNLEKGFIIHITDYDTLKLALVKDMDSAPNVEPLTSRGERARISANGPQKAHFGRFLPLRARSEDRDFKPWPGKGKGQGSASSILAHKGQGPAIFARPLALKM